MIVFVGAGFWFGCVASGLRVVVCWLLLCFASCCCAGCHGVCWRWWSGCCVAAVLVRVCSLLLRVVVRVVLRGFVALDSYLVGYVCCG